MGGYIFMGIPRGTPKLDYASLVEFFMLDSDWHVNRYMVKSIGTTVEIEQAPSSMINKQEFRIRLYGTTIAHVRDNGTVYFPSHGYRTQATRAWIERVVQDNRIGGSVYSIRGWKRYRHGAPSYYAIDSMPEHPLEGNTFTVSRGANVQ